MDFEAVIDFWFDEIDPASWWKKDTIFDDLIRQRFLSVHQAALRCELSAWRDQALGRLAEIIVLDQFSRNIYRDDGRAFAGDALALVLAQEAVRTGDDGKVSSAMRAFVYMPYMHSESVYIHQQAIQLFDQAGLESNLDFERQHQSIIDRFGRYPHRNQALGRISTAEEKAFLTGSGASF